MFNRQPRKAIGVWDGVKTGTNESDGECGAGVGDDEDCEDLSSLDALMERLVQLRYLIHAKAKINVAAAQGKQKKQYDTKPRFAHR